MSDETSSELEAAEGGSKSRRELLTTAAIATAVTSVAALSMSNKASAADSDPVLVGYPHTGANSTSFSGGTALVVANGSSNTTATKQASIVGTQTVANRVGVLGSSTGTDGWGVYGRATGSSGRGVYGLATGTEAVGVYGEHDNSTASGTGVLGFSGFGDGVVGAGTTADLVADGSGRVVLRTAGVPAVPAGGAVGTIARDSSGNVWVAVAASTWRKIAGPASAGAFHALSPTRVFDTRVAAPAPGALATGNNVLVSVKDGRDLDTGAVSAADVVPAGATAIACNLVITGTAGLGFLALNPGGELTVTGSSINWGGDNQTVANGLIIALNDSRELSVIAGGAGSTHVVIDVNGYFL